MLNVYIILPQTCIVMSTDISTYNSDVDTERDWSSCILLLCNGLESILEVLSYSYIPLEKFEILPKNVASQGY